MLIIWFGLKHTSRFLCLRLLLVGSTGRTGYALDLVACMSLVELVDELVSLLDALLCCISICLRL